jgi:creatinine amidohydrolase
MTDFARRDFLLTGAGISAAWTSARGEERTLQPEPDRFEAVAGFELAEVVKSHPLALVPLGSLEYHGPHNPLGTDSIIVSGVAEQVAVRTHSLLFPTVILTHCPAHTAHFQGTLSMRPEVMTMYFEDLLRAVRNAGFTRIFVLNGHDGNIGPARGAISKVADEQPPAAILFASWWETLPGEEMEKMAFFRQSNGGHGHGGPLETSAVAAFRPEWVHLDMAKDLPPTPDFSSTVPYYLEKPSAPGWPGYSGVVSEASADKGKQIVKIAVNRLTELIQTWLSHPDDPGSW